MIIFRGLVNFYARSVTIGDFDGLHLGHQAVLSRLERPSCLITFRQNTKVTLGKRPYTPSILPFKTFVNLLANLNVDYICVLDFKKIRFWSAEKFVSRIIEFINPSLLILGETAKLGVDQIDTQTLENLFQGQLRVIPVKEVKFDGEKISSSKLRLQVLSGNFDEFIAMTGRRFTTLVKRTPQGLFFKPHLLPKTGLFETDKGFITFKDGQIVNERLSIKNDCKFEVVEFIRKIGFSFVDSVISRCENI